MLNTICLRGTPLVTGNPLEFLWLITAICARNFGLISFYLTVCLSSLYFISLYEDTVCESVESLVNVKINCSSLVYQTSHLIVESYHVGQA